MGAWALNQTVRRRRRETDALLAAGQNLRAAHEQLLAGGDPAALRDAMQEERALTDTLANCAETLATETGKSGPALKERVRATLHAAAVDNDTRKQLASGRLVREGEAVGLGPLGELAAVGPAPAKRERARPAKRDRPTPAKRERRAAAKPGPPVIDQGAERLAAAELSLEEARAALAEAQAARSVATGEVESAGNALRKAEAAERDARRVERERTREVAKRERQLERLQPKQR